MQKSVQKDLLEIIIINSVVGSSGLVAVKHAGILQLCMQHAVPCSVDSNLDINCRLHSMFTKYPFLSRQQYLQEEGFPNLQREWCHQQEGSLCDGVISGHVTGLLHLPPLIVTIVMLMLSHSLAASLNHPPSNTYTLLTE